MKHKLPFHRGVGLLIANEDQSRFFVQQKDETYPYPEWQLAYSFWGGAIEANETPQEALFRELFEELPSYAPTLIKKEPSFAGSFSVFTGEKDFFELNVFLLSVDNQFFETFSSEEVLEGYGRFVGKEELLSSAWIWNTSFILEKIT